MTSYVPGQFLSSLANMMSGGQSSTAPTAEPPARRGKKRGRIKIELPSFELPDWMREPPTLPDVSDAVLPTVPTPDPLTKLSVSSGEELRLRKKRRGLMASIGAGETGGWMK